MKVFVTGSAGHLARVLLPRLCSHPSITRVTGIDRLKTRYTHNKLHSHRLDLRDARIAERLPEHDVLIHLAFITTRSLLGLTPWARHNEREMYDINVTGSARLFEQARAAAIPHIVYNSSASVYGAWPDNPTRVNEDQVRRIMPDFAYARHKVLVEDWLDGFEPTYAGSVIRLRPHVIMGPHAIPLLKRVLLHAGYPRLPEPQPLTQLVHEQDVVGAIINACFRPRRGTYNLGTEPLTTLMEMKHVLHHRPRPLPFKALKAVHRLLWNTLGVGEDPGWMQATQYPLALDSRRAQQDLGWHPRYDTLQILQELKR